MDFDQLHTFLEIVRLKSFSKAAQTCYRTQPAISAQVRQLEQELKTSLFERFGSRISLTTAGKIFATYAEQMLELRRQAQDAINELEHTPRGELVIAANEATCIYVLPRVFSEYKNQFPAVQLQVDRSYGTRVVEAVMENIADFGLTQLPVEEKRLQVVTIHRDEIRLIVPSGHPLAERKLIQAHELVSYPLLLPKSGKTRSRLDTWFEVVEGEIRISMELDSTEMMKRFVMAGLGVAFLAQSNCREEIASGKLHAIPLGPEPMLRRLGLIYRKDKALSKAALGFIQVVMENLEDRRVREKTKVPQVLAG
ncbi:MAG TPA: LysR family transcriptional regulator [Bryobacteraceae bacterium]|nr:LysR family transcriptional regulator [Bryobacteraceae bacterium]